MDVSRRRPLLAVIRSESLAPSMLVGSTALMLAAIVGFLLG